MFKNNMIVFNSNTKDYTAQHIITNIVFLLTNIMLVIDFAFPNINFQFVVETGLFIITLINIPLIVNINLNTRDVLLISTVSLIAIILMIYKLIYLEISLVEIKYIATSLFIFIIFSKINIEDRVYNLLSIIILVGAAVVVFSRQGDYSLGSYFYSEKNSFAPLLLISTVWIIASYKNKLAFSKFLSITFVIIVIIFLSLIQSRLNLIGVLLLLLVSLINQIVSKKITTKMVLTFITVIPLVIIFLNYLFHTSIFKKVILREDYLRYVSGSNWFDKVTSGRLTSTMNNLSFFKQDPLLGTKFNLEMIINDPNSSVGIHSIWLRFISYGGILLFILFSLFVIFLVIKVTKEKQNINLALFLLLIGLLNSLGEPYAPFGPTSSYFIYWSLLGLSIRRAI